MPFPSLLGIHIKPMLQSGTSSVLVLSAALANTLQRAFWIGIGSLEIAMDMALIMIPVFVLWKVQTSWARKGAIIFAFAARAM